MKRRTAAVLIAASIGHAVFPVTAHAEPAAAPDAAEARRHAIDILVSASMGDDAALRSNSLEAMQLLPDRALPIAQKGLVDANPAVRFAAVVTAGQMKFGSLAAAVEPLLKDVNPSVRAAAIYSLHTLGQKIDITPLAGMLTSHDPSLRSNVALLLGLMGDASAAPMLKEAANSPMPRIGGPQAAVVRIQVAEAIAKLGDDSSLDALRAGAYSQFDEVRVLAVTAMGAVGDKRMAPAIERMLGGQGPKPAANEMPVEIKLAAAAALARLGDSKGAPIAIAGASNTAPVVRAQAAWVLGWFKDEATMAQAVRLLNDPTPQVRVAAAASVVRRTNAPVPGAIGAPVPANPANTARPAK